MIIFKHAADLSAYLERQRAAGNRIGFVPTMGALHEGHISLISISKGNENENLTVCSIFINPTQFNDPADFQKYPVSIEKDIAMLEKAGTDVLFLPEVSEMYPGGTTGLEHYDLGALETVLEGKYRPGHFQGVCQVMQRLLSAVRPDDLYMGAKDYQQCQVVYRLTQLMGLDIGLLACPIVREPDGLAKSSRNVRLDPDQRSRATAIYKALNTIKAGWPALIGHTAAGEPKPIPPADWSAAVDKLTSKATGILESAGFRVDYVAIADERTLQPYDPGSDHHALALIAAVMGEVRLIDNMFL